MADAEMCTFGNTAPALLHSGRLWTFVDLGQRVLLAIGGLRCTFVSTQAAEHCAVKLRGQVPQMT